VNFSPDQLVRLRTVASPRVISGAVVMSVLLPCLLLSLVLWVRPQLRTPRSPGVLQVQTIEVVDRLGNVRARIGVASDGTPSVRLYDPAGTRRLELAVGSNGPTATNV
jgi:hypothetical protein